MSIAEQSAALAQYRHECEVRSWIKLKIQNPKEFTDRMAGLISKCAARRARVLADIEIQMRKGNKGEWGCWK